MFYSGDQSRGLVERSKIYEFYLPEQFQTDLQPPAHTTRYKLFQIYYIKIIIV